MVGFICRQDSRWWLDDNLPGADRELDRHVSPHELADLLRRPIQGLPVAPQTLWRHLGNRHSQGGSPDHSVPVDLDLCRSEKDGRPQPDLLVLELGQRPRLLGNGAHRLDLILRNGQTSTPIRSLIAALIHSLEVPLGGQNCSK